jgi:hypothetical protein
MNMSVRRRLGRPGAGRFGATTLIAAGLHALAFALMTTSKAPPLVLAPAPRASEPIAIEMDAPPAARTPEVPRKEEPPEPAAPAPRSPQSRRAAVAPAPLSPSPVETGGDDGAGEIAGSGATPGGSTVTAAPPAAGGSASGAAVVEPPPPLVPRAIHARRDVLEAPLAAGNTSAGLTASAQIMGTVQRLSSSDEAPRNGHGTVRIVVDEDGNVSGVTTTSPSWSAVARAIRAALAGRRFRVPPGRHGVVISIAVDARMTSTPAVLTGETRAEPMAENEVPRGSSASTAAPRMAVINPLALLPVLRHVVKVQLLSEEPR